MIYIAQPRGLRRHTLSLDNLQNESSRSKTGADVLLSPLTSLSSLDGDVNETNPLRGMGVEDVRLALVGYANGVLSSLVIDVMASCF